MQDAFTSCGLPLPPGMDFEKAVASRSHDPLYKAQMRAFRGYRHRVFGVISLIEKHPINHTGSFATSLEKSLPEITPAKKRACPNNLILLTPHEPLTI